MVSQKSRGPRVDMSTTSLRSLRVSKGWTQLDLAFQSGLTPTTVSRLENGWQSPNLDTARRLATVLSVPLDALVGSIIEYQPPRQTPASVRARKAARSSDRADV